MTLMAEKKEEKPKPAIGPVSAFTRVIGRVWEKTKRELSPGEEEGTFKIDRTVVDQGALGSVIAEAAGIAPMARVAITGGIVGVGAGDSPTAVSARARLSGFASHHIDESDTLRINESRIVGSASVAASIEKGSAQATIGPVTAIVGES